MERQAAAGSLDEASEAQRPRNRFAHYHAHVYFDQASVEQARTLCEQAAERFGVPMGRMHHAPVGPHPRWSCQLTFDAELFEALVPWLDAHRGGFSVLVHPSTGDALADHTRHAGWLGEPVALNLSMFTAGDRKP